MIARWPRTKSGCPNGNTRSSPGPSILPRKRQDIEDSVQATLMNSVASALSEVVSRTTVSVHNSVRLSESHRLGDSSPNPPRAHPKGHKSSYPSSGRSPHRTKLTPGAVATSIREMYTLGAASPTPNRSRPGMTDSLCGHSLRFPSILSRVD